MLFPERPRCRVRYVDDQSRPRPTAPVSSPGIAVPAAVMTGPLAFETGGPTWESPGAHSWLVFAVISSSSTLSAVSSSTCCPTRCRSRNPVPRSSGSSVVRVPMKRVRITSRARRDGFRMHREMIPIIANQALRSDMQVGASTRQWLASLAVPGGQFALCRRDRWGDCFLSSRRPDRRRLVTGRGAQASAARSR